MLNIVNKFLKVSISSLLAAMVLVVTWQVISRYFLSSPSPWTEEVARILLIWIGFIGAAFAHSERAHLGIDLLEHNLSAKGKSALYLFVNVICGVFAVAVLVVGGALLVNLTWQLEQTTAVLGLPMSWVYAVLPLSGVIISLQSIAYIFTRETPA